MGIRTPRTRAQWLKPSSSATELPRCQPHHPPRATTASEASPVRDAWSPEPGPCRPRTTTSPDRPAWIETHRSRRRQRVRAQRPREPPAASPSIPLAEIDRLHRDQDLHAPRRNDHAAPFQRAERSSPASRRRRSTRNARDHRADEDFQDRSVQRSLLSRRPSNITAAKPGASDLSIARPLADRRHPNSCCEVIPVTPRRTSDTTAPTASVSSRIRAFSSDDHRRRRPGPVNTSTRRASLGFRLQAYGQTYSRADPKNQRSESATSHVRRVGMSAMRLFGSTYASSCAPLGSKRLWATGYRGSARRGSRWPKLVARNGHGGEREKLSGRRVARGKAPKRQSSRLQATTGPYYAHKVCCHQRARHRMRRTADFRPGKSLAAHSGRGEQA